jgi:integrase
MRGSVHRRGSTWSYHLDLGTDPGTGKRLQRTKGGFRTKDDAQHALDALKTHIRSGLPIAPAKLTVKSYLEDRWLPAMKPTVAANTADSYERMVTTHLVPRLGNLQLEKLDGGHLTAMYAELATKGRKDGKGGLGARSVRLAHVTIHRALKDAVRWGLVARNAADAADPPRLPHQDAPTWTPEHVQAFLGGAKNDRWHAAWILAATTGLRRGELAALRWADLDLDAKRLSVRQAAAMVGGHVIVSAPKTARSRRSIALDAGTVTALKTWRKKQLEDRFKMGAGWQDRDDRVFTLATGAPASPDLLTRSFDDAVAGARPGLPRITLHGLRHAHATAMLAAGVPLKIVADRLGHASVRVTGDVYSHVVAGLDEQAAETVGRLLLGKSG